MTSDLEEAYLFTKCEAMSWCTYVNDGLARVNNKVVCSRDSNLFFVYSITTSMHSTLSLTFEHNGILLLSLTVVDSLVHPFPILPNYGLLQPETEEFL